MQEEESEEEEQRKPPVPMDLSIKSHLRAVIITGPNTGGKTASLKVGLSRERLRVPDNNRRDLCQRSQAREAHPRKHWNRNHSKSLYKKHVRHEVFVMRAASKPPLPASSHARTGLMQSWHLSQWRQPQCCRTCGALHQSLRTSGCSPAGSSGNVV